MELNVERSGEGPGGPQPVCGPPIGIKESPNSRLDDLRLNRRRYQSEESRCHSRALHPHDKSHPVRPHGVPERRSRTGRPVRRSTR
jgi:hypothetical protein